MIILMSNLGYLRGINGCLAQHMRFAHRHVYCSPKVQRQSLAQLAQILAQEKPDLCCFVEIDSGSSDLGYFNQLEALISDEYPYSDIENKYGAQSRLRQLPRTRGKSNGFIARRPFAAERLYFAQGTKRLIYKVSIAPDVTVFFTHFSLKKTVRAEQLREMRRLLQDTPGEIILLGDFNVHSGFSELAPLLQENQLLLLNEAHVPTFRFHTLQLPLDLCICSPGIAKRSTLTIIHQPYSDHDALLLKIDEETRDASGD